MWKLLKGKCAFSEPGVPWLCNAAADSYRRGLPLGISFPSHHLTYLSYAE